MGGYSPIGFVRCGRSACRISKLKWKMGKETGGKKMEDPHSLKSNEMAQCSFQPQQPLVCDTFKNCEGLSLPAARRNESPVGEARMCELASDVSCILQVGASLLTGSVLDCTGRRERGSK